MSFAFLICFGFVFIIQAELKRIADAKSAYEAGLQKLRSGAPVADGLSLIIQAAELAPENAEYVDMREKVQKVNEQMIKADALAAKADPKDLASCKQVLACYDAAVVLPASTDNPIRIVMDSVAAWRKKTADEESRQKEGLQLFSEGKSALGQGHADEAASLLAQASDLVPENADYATLKRKSAQVPLLWKSAKADIAVNHFDSAITSLETALKLFPDNAPLQSALQEAHKEKADYEVYQ